MAQGPWQHLAWSLGHGVPHGGRVRVPCFPSAPLASTLVLHTIGMSGKRVADARDHPHAGPLTPPCALQMWMSVRPGMCVTMASAPTRQAPSNVSASPATIYQETGADVRVSGA